MRSTNPGPERWWRDGLYAGAAAVALAIALPLVVVFLFVMRAALLAAALVALAAVAAGVVLSPRFRDWLRYVGETLVSYKGISLATDVGLAPGHVWARLRGGTAEIGPDDLMQAAIGPVDRVELAAVGRHVAAGAAVFGLHRGGRSLVGRTPMAGTVVAVNAALYDEPARVNAAPFTAGWAVRLAADDPARGRHALRRGREARELFRREVDRLLGVVAAAEGAPALADGGEVVSSIHAHIDEPTWRRLQATIFSGADAAAA
jgi:glycine cleavage system H protein